MGSKQQTVEIYKHNKIKLNKNQILKMPETRVPMTLRDSFLQDDFFKSAWEDMETFRSKFFKNTSSSMKMIENNNNVENKSVSKFDDDFGGWMMPRKWMLPSLNDEKFFKSDNGVINMTEDDTKIEISLNTSGNIKKKAKFDENFLQNFIFLGKKA